MPEDTGNIVASAVADYKESNGIEASAETYDAPEPISDIPEATESAEPTSEGDVSEVAETAEVPVTPEPTVVPVSEIPPTDEGELGPEKDKWGRVNRIPQPRVAKIVAKAVAKQEEVFAAERTAHAAKIAEHDKRFKEIDNVERLMFDEQDKFLGILDTIPGYKERLAARYGGATTPATAVAQPEDGMPQPDTEGGYSQKGLAALFDWNARQVETRITARQKAEREEQETVSKRQQAVSTYAAKAAAEARSWPGFKENEAEIVALMAADARVTHESAYRRIVLPKLETDKTKLAAEIRAQVIADLKKAPASTGTAPTPAKRVAPVSDGPRDTSDIIRDAIRAAK